jgi:hypothetical protein
MNGITFGKSLLNRKCVFWFSLQLLPETFRILRRIKRDVIINVYRSSTRYSFQILIKRQIPRQNFEKFLNAKSHENLSSGSRGVACGQTDRQTDRHDEASSRCSGNLRRRLRRLESWSQASPPKFERDVYQLQDSLLDNKRDDGEEWEIAVGTVPRGARLQKQADDRTGNSTAILKLSV